MSDFLSFTIVGLATAAIYAIGASGLVLTYTTTGVFNFAHGAIGMLGAFMYWQLRFDWGLPAPIAFVLVLFVFAPLVGGFLERVIFRGLQGTTEAVRLVVTVSLLFAMIGVANWVWDPLENRASEKFFGASSLKLFGEIITYQELIRIGAAIVVAITLRILLYRTRAGVAMRASVDDRPLASLNGARPDRSAMLAWAIGCSLAMLAGMLYMGGIALEASSISLLIVNAYAAAMVGRLRSLPMTFVGAIVIALAQQYWDAYAPEANEATWAKYFGNPIVFSIPIIVLFVVLLALPAARLRGHGLTRTREFYPMPRWRGASIFAAIVIGGTLMAIPLLTSADALTTAKLFGTGIIALSLVPLVGLGGQVSLCQLSLAGVGAVTMAHLGAGGSPMGLVWAIVFSAIVGAIIALPALRLSGIYLALATASFAVFMDRWVWKLDPFKLPFTDTTISLFETGSISVRRLRILGFDTGAKGSVLGFDLSPEDRQLIVMAVAFVAVAMVVVAIRRGPFGRRLLAMKDSEAACATVGMNLTRTKLGIFAASAAMAGFGGALIGGVGQSTNATQWEFINGLPIFMIGVVGGMGRIGGALFAGISLQALGSMSSWPVLNTRFFGMGPPTDHWFFKFSGASPGFMGVGLGRNPNGAVADMRQAFEPIMHSKRALSMAAIIIGGLYIAVLTLPVLNGWSFILGTIVALMIGAQIGKTDGIRQGTIEPDVNRSLEEFGGTYLEWIGIDREVTDTDIALLDAKLGLSGAPR
jgi:branched-chain amino acid transport system permease protein